MPFPGMGDGFADGMGIRKSEHQGQTDCRGKTGLFEIENGRAQMLIEARSPELPLVALLVNIQKIAHHLFPDRDRRLGLAGIVEDELQMLLTFSTSVRLGLTREDESSGFSLRIRDVD